MVFKFTSTPRPRAPARAPPPAIGAHALHLGPHLPPPPPRVTLAPTQPAGEGNANRQAVGKFLGAAGEAAAASTAGEGGVGDPQAICSPPPSYPLHPSPSDGPIPALDPLRVWASH